MSPHCETTIYIFKNYYKRQFKNELIHKQIPKTNVSKYQNIQLNI